MRRGETPTVDGLLALAEPGGVDGECWLWKKGLSGDGYAQVWWNGRDHRVSRLLWSLLNGQIPDGADICHTCDTPRCISPVHLWPGSRLQNVQDMLAKGRGWTGRKHTPESLAKIGAAKRGRTLTTEHRAKIGAGHAGKPWSEKRRAAQSRRKALAKPATIT